MIDRHTGGILFDKVAIAGLLDESCDTIHGPGEGLLLPPVAVRRPILHRGHAMCVGHELKRVGALGTEAALVHGALRIALDVDHLARLREHKEAAANRAIRTHTLGHLGAAQTGLRRRRAGTERLLISHSFAFLVRHKVSLESLTKTSMGRG